MSIDCSKYYSSLMGGGGGGMMIYILRKKLLYWRLAGFLINGYQLFIPELFLQNLTAQSQCTM